MTAEQVKTELVKYVREPVLIMALCIWREARGESQVARVAVGHVILNRCALAPAEGFRHTVADNVLKPYAFSSFNTGDPNSTKFPTQNGTWQECATAAWSAITGAMPDQTSGAVFYHDSSLPGPPKKRDGGCAWGDVVKTAVIGRLTFYRLKDKCPKQGFTPSTI